MADVCDLAQDHMEREGPLALAAARKPAGPKANGGCHNCGETVAPGHLFCDTECRDDYDKRVVAAARRPKGDV